MRLPLKETAEIGRRPFKHAGLVYFNLEVSEELRRDLTGLWQLSVLTDVVI